MPGAEDIDARAVDLLRGARRIAVLTGAGMSADSGIPTFRGRHDSLWSRFDPLRLATAEAWRADPALVWGWYRWRMALVARAAPHAGHRALARLQASRPGLTLVTQNVDDLHERAGSQVAAHLHGRLDALRCVRCAEPYDGVLPAFDLDAPALRLDPPGCPRCGGGIRPGVVWFGEALPEADWTRAEAAATGCDLMLVVGTSGLVHPAAGLPALARARGARVVEINPEPGAPGAHVDLHRPGTAAAVLPGWVDALLAAAPSAPGPG